MIIQTAAAIEIESGQYSAIQFEINSEKESKNDYAAAEQTNIHDR